jgi:peptidoglycan hydrolase-like protein with peptidoglycan-binding domain
MERIDTLILVSILAPALSLSATDTEVVRAQILLDRARFSPGEIDGVYGGALQIAIRGYQERHGLQPTGRLDSATWKLLDADKKPLFTTYTITALDSKGPYQPIPDDILQQARLKRLGYESIAERIGEKFHLSPKLLAELNPGKKLKASEKIKVPNVSRPPTGPAARVNVSKSKRTVTAFNTAG